MKKKRMALKLNVTPATPYLISESDDQRYITSLDGGAPTYSKRPPYLFFTAMQARKLKQLLGIQFEEASSVADGKFVTVRAFERLLQHMGTVLDDRLDKPGNAGFKRYAALAARVG
jgi:hypothetical protein